MPETCDVVELRVLNLHKIPASAGGGRENRTCTESGRRGTSLYSCNAQMSKM